MSKSIEEIRAALFQFCESAWTGKSVISTPIYEMIDAEVILRAAIDELATLRETLRWRKFSEVKPPLNIDAVEVFSADRPGWNRDIEHLEAETWDWEGFEGYTHWRPTTPPPEEKENENE